MDLGLQGKRALVTGSSAGIGEACVKELARERAHVVVHGRNSKELARVVQEITSLGGKAVAVQGDLASDLEASEVAKHALAAFNGIDILVNNAGSYPFHDWEHTEPGFWLELFNVNVVSMVRMIAPIVPQMKKRGWGRIIQISSIAGTHPKAGSPEYAATKAANLNMTCTLAKDMAATGITVNSVSPGPILTPGTEDFFYKFAQERNWGTDWKEIERHVASELLPTLTGRIGRAEEVASLVTFLCSPRADFITGSNYRIDGGRAASVN